jgi:hypothetical protein
MGFVEVGGNGSVVWHAQHDQGSHGQGHTGGGWGRDKIPPRGSGAVFTLLINGKPVPGLPDLPVDSTKISVTWGSHGPGNPIPDSGADGVPLDQDKVMSNFGRLVAASNPGGGGASGGGKGGAGSSA